MCVQVKPFFFSVNEYCDDPGLEINSAEWLPGTCEALTSIPSTTKRKQLYQTALIFEFKERDTALECDDSPRVPVS